MAPGRIENWKGSFLTGKLWEVWGFIEKLVKVLLVGDQLDTVPVSKDLAADSRAPEDLRRPPKGAHVVLAELCPCSAIICSEQPMDEDLVSSH